MNYTPHTPEDISHALSVIGVSSVQDLFQDIPASLENPPIQLPPPLDEFELLEHMRGLAAKNVNAGSSFLGGGARTHFIPSVVESLTFQSEFVTAYTPYQAEVAQGELQALFEYQSMLCELTGLDVSNSSLYDGATAVAEAALLALRQTGRNKVLVSKGVHPEYRETLHTFLECIGASWDELPLEGALTTVPLEGEKDFSTLEQYGAVIVQNPNFLGSLEDMQKLSDWAHSSGALFISVVDPLSLAVLKSPGEYGADIAVGDGQVIGNSPNFGGPAYGFITVKENLMRQLPGRIVGATKDVDGRRGFVLTLQAREQHIRRAKAKSNICSNHALMALESAIYLSSVGPQGLKEVALVSALRARQLREKLEEMGFESVTPAQFFVEFAVKLPRSAEEVRSSLAERGVHACVPVPLEYGYGDAGLFACTEKTTQKDLEKLILALEQVSK